MSEAVMLAVIGVLGGAGGLATLVKTVLDHRAQVSSREQDADERLVTRLERRLNNTEKRLTDVELALEDERAFNALLIQALAKSGIDIPARPRTT